MRRSAEQARWRRTKQGETTPAGNRSSLQVRTPEPDVPWVERIAYEDDEETDTEMCPPSDSNTKSSQGGTETSGGEVQHRHWQGRPGW